MTAYQNRILADGASAYWPLDDPPGSVTARDRAGVLHGAINGGVTLGVPGVFATGATAMTFDGVGGHIATGAKLLLPNIATLEAWVRLTDAAQNPIISNRDGMDGHVVIFGVYGARELIYSASGGGYGGVVVLNDDRWHHAVAVLTGTTGEFFLDGVPNGSVTPFDRSIPGTNPFRIGRDGNEYYAGSMQDVAVYPRALTATEIAEHYALQLAPPPPEPVGAYQTRIVADGALAYWPLDDAVGSTTARDATSAARHLALSGGISLGTPGPRPGDATAAAFDGLTGKLVTAIEVQIPETVTFEAWIRRDVPHPDGREADIYTPSWDSTGSAYHIATGYGNDETAVFLKWTCNNSFQESPTLLGTTWHHAVYVFDGVTMTATMYLDGQLDSTGPYSSGGVTAGSPAFIGWDAIGGSDHWFGQLADVAIYPRILSATDIAEHHTLRLGIVSPPPAHLTMLEAVRARLLQVPEVVALVGDRVTLLIGQQSAASRSIRLQEISRLDSAHLRGADDLRPSRIQVDVFVKKGDGDAYTVAHDIADAVRGDFVGGVPTGLVGFRGVIGDVAITAITGGIQREMFDPDELQVVRVLSEYFVWFKYTGGVSPLSASNKGIAQWQT